MFSKFAEKKIFEEGEKIYPISKSSDEESEKNTKIKNWAETFYKFKEGKLKERFIERVKNSEYSKFFEGLNFEYGINNYPINLQKAFKIYKDSANNSTDVMSMFRMYYIYKKDFKKFKIPKRNRILEKFYLFKCYSFLRNPIFDRSEHLCNRFDITYELYIQFEKEDENLEKFHKFIKFLNKNYKLYEINSKDLIIIESVIIYTFTTDNYKKEKALATLKKMSEYNLEALYKYACFSDEKEKEEKFKILYDRGYYRSYVDYAIFLNSQKRTKEALDILTLARKKGIINAGYIYYDIYLNNTDFSLLMKEAVSSSFSEKCELYNLFEILMSEIITENIYLIFDFIYLRKICIKHYKLENEINQHFLVFTKEIINFLNIMTSEKSEIKKKEIIKSIYSRDDYYDEVHLASGELYFYGINKLLEKDYQKALYFFNISFNSSSSESYRRFCYYFIYRTRKKLYEKSKLNNNIININNNIIINEKVMKDTENSIYDLFYKSLNQKISNLSSSYFYYFSRLLNRKIGNKGDKLLEFICLNKAKDLIKNDPGYGSIISIYRRYKSIILLDKLKDECTEVFSNIQKYNDSEGYGDDGTICPICFENKRTEIALPCKHLFCSYCLGKCEKCPICRTFIIMSYKYNSS